MKQFLATLLAMACTAMVWADVTRGPVHGAPRWQVVTGVPDAPGSPVAVYSLETGQVIGHLKMNEKFLTFGEDERVFTLAFNGSVGYIDRNAATALYPVDKTEPPFRMWGKTLEEQAEEAKSRERDAKGISLEPINMKKIAPKATGQPGVPGLGTAPVRGK
jgi:hypothetical protein